MAQPLRTFLRALAGIALGLALAASAGSLDVAQLMSALAKSQRSSATFTEKKYLAVLDKPVESSGELLFVAPAHLEKRTLQPRRETLLLDGDTLTLERSQRKRTLRLSSYPEIAAIIESIRATLAGDADALRRHYRVSLVGTSESWSLLLTPLDRKVVAVVSRIRIEGREDLVQTVEILQADGDRSVMRIDTGAPTAQTP